MPIATVALLRHGGSHLIRPIVAGLGFEIVEPGRKGVPLDHAEGPAIVFLRDPRDRMAATYRWWSTRAGKSARLMAAGTDTDSRMAWLLMNGGTPGFLPEMLRWARVWCKKPEACRVHFEQLRQNGPAEVARIARHLGLPPCNARDEDLFAEVYGHGRTYTGRHSDWREWFGPKSNAVWTANGGPDLMHLMGYE